jgi:hypothetical protein
LNPIWGFWLCCFLLWVVVIGEQINLDVYLWFVQFCVIFQSKQNKLHIQSWSIGRYEQTLALTLPARVPAGKITRVVIKLSHEILGSNHCSRLFWLGERSICSGCDMENIIAKDLYFFYIFHCTLCGTIVLETPVSLWS